MAQKKKSDFRLLNTPGDVSEIKKKVRRLYLEKARRALVLVVLIVLAISGTYLLLTNSAYEHARTASEYPTDTSDSSNYIEFANGVVRYNRDGVAFLNKKNEEQWIQPVQIRTPIIEVKKHAFAVADSGGNNIFVFTKEGLKGEIETSLPIERLAISDQGIVTVVLKNEALPKIISYDATGNVLVEQQVTASTMGYPIAIDMSDNGKMLGVSYLYTQDGTIKSQIIYYNFGEQGKGKPDNIVLKEIYQNTVIADIFFIGNDRSVAVGDNGFVIYKGREIPKKEKEVPLKQEIQSLFHSDKYIGMILLNPEKSGYEMRLYNGLGEQVINKEVSGRFSRAKLLGDEVIMYEGSRCCIVTATGIQKFEGDIKTEALEIFKASGVNRYYVMSPDELKIIYLTK